MTDNPLIEWHGHTITKRAPGRFELRSPTGTTTISDLRTIMTEFWSIFHKKAL